MNERDLRRHVLAVREQIDGDAGDHPDLELELFPYVDGSLRSEAIEAHLRTCARCAEDVRDLRLSAPPSRSPVVRRPWRVPSLIAAMVAAMAVAALLVLRDDVPPPEPLRPHSAAPVLRVPAPQPDQYEPLLRAARAGELPPLPAVLRNMPRGETLRGGAADAPSLAPAGVVVESQAPTLTWSAAPGERAVVSIFANGREVQTSEPVTGGRWRPRRPLQRGVTYSWEVRIENGESVRILPEPPAPPAVFHVLDGATHAELARARGTRGGDPLLLALLYARAGLVEDAREEATRVREPADRVVAERILSILPSAGRKSGYSRAPE